MGLRIHKPQLVNALSLSMISAFHPARATPLLYIASHADRPAQEPSISSEPPALASVQHSLCPSGDAIAEASRASISTNWAIIEKQSPSPPGVPSRISIRPVNPTQAPRAVHAPPRSPRWQSSGSMWIPMFLRDRGGWMVEDFDGDVQGEANIMSNLCDRLPTSHGKLPTIEKIEQSLSMRVGMLSPRRLHRFSL